MLARRLMLGAAGYLKMAGDKRITYRRRKAYNTKSNKVRVARTPGGKLAVHYV